MDRSIVWMAAFVASLAAAPALAADDTLRGTLVSVEDEGKTFTIQTSEGKRHSFEAPADVDLGTVEPGSNLQVTAERITEVAGEERRKATAVAVLAPEDRSEAKDPATPIGGDPASGGAPGGGPPSGGIPGGGVPSGGVPSGGAP